MTLLQKRWCSKGWKRGSNCDPKPEEAPFAKQVYREPPPAGLAPALHLDDVLHLCHFYYLSLSHFFQ